MKRIDMNHPAHFIGADNCKFFRASYVNGFIVSTIGDYQPHSTGKREEIGLNRFYETMVFKAKKMPKGGCTDCPYTLAKFNELECEGYNTEGAAIEGHERICKQYARKKKP